MTTLGVVGFTGYSGRHITAEALDRGHRVIGVCRTVPAEAPAGVQILQGSIADTALMDTLFTDTEVVLVAIHATADGQPFLVGLVGDLLARAAHYRTRVGIIGGSGSLLTFDGGPRLLDSSEFRFKNRVEAGAQADVLAALRADEGDADWFYASPAFVYGAHAPGVQTGTYRIGSDVLLRNPSGISEISGPDFASAVLDEVQSPRHHRRRFTAAH